LTKCARKDNIIPFTKATRNIIFNVAEYVQKTQLGTDHYLWRGVAPKRNVFFGKNFADPTIKKVKNLITQPQISIKK
jgi:hypothetical protein